jgi:hypothetical protein
MARIGWTAVRRAVLLVALIAGATAAPAQGAFAPLDQPGPELTASASDLRRALRCTGLEGARREPVLLIPGTTVDPDEAFDWNWVPALDARGIPHCSVTLPQRTNGDIQLAAEYVVAAVRRMHEISGRKVVMLGWSQGGSTLPRWALRFWPDVRERTASLVGMAPLNETGSLTASALCVPGTCIPAAWQQARGSRFMTALNSRARTFPGIAYTVIYSRLDEVLTPNLDGALSKLPAGPNVTNAAVQDVCPLDVSEHLAIVVSPTTFRIAIDAIEHPGRPARVPTQVPLAECVPGTMPGVSPVELVTAEARMAANLAIGLTQGMVPREPGLRCYVTASCPAPPATAARCRPRVRIALRQRAGRRIVRVEARVPGRRLVRARGSRLRSVVVLRPAGGRATVRIATRDDRGRLRVERRRVAACPRA